ncbi:phosphoribosylglycinamide formyltransferase [Kocuria indica]|uniref:Phosphoribosylglycinamide formyltransferase n=1 Tax=Kocuria marina subsp. indica TaxID=1049583 RepID=A0A6N9QW16_9MICC|nr:MULTISPECIES: phosphoribosylglycinamide formyltransferase [Kocuria]MBX7556392.1 phosphoribosylglycinamide formyltransferase [Streptomyces sp. tea 10]MBN6812359.1 phosphoribosylglycinamide formyltransferase [Kocuria indica]MBN6844082.1 phosphoribosylglycinamide formyltransferase [Kocuria indica]MCG7431976.1 phosphoribosylglycinamide formyltransferase [Kocuria indica]MCT1617237.1 phosphoribosylglycinamide formyltransferase [Kocuria marina]
MRLVVLVSGSGTNLQAMIDALHQGDVEVDIAAVGADLECAGLDRARAAGIDTFVVPLSEYPDREQWNRALQRRVASYHPDRVVFAGFMRIVDAEFVSVFPGRIINTHPSLLPSFPGAHAVRDALAYGVKVTGATVHEVVADVDAGPILAQVAVPVAEDDTEAVLHERIKSAERTLLVNALAKLSWDVTSTDPDLPRS